MTPTPRPAVIRAASRRPRVLMLTHRVPLPPDRGDRIRAYHLLRHLAGGCDVSLACTSDEPVSDEQIGGLLPLCDRLRVRPISPRVSRLRGGLALLAGEPVTPHYFFRGDLLTELCRWHAETPFDAVLTFCTGMIGYARDLLGAIASAGLSRPRHLLDLVDVDSAKWGRYADAARGPKRWVYRAEARRLRAIEAGRRDPLDAVTVVSDAEAAAYRQTVGAHPGLAVLRQAVDLDYFVPRPGAAEQPGELLFVGNLSYRPNVEGLDWFMANVLPRLRAARTGAVLRVVGRDVCPAVRAMGRVPGVEVVGPVRDVRPSVWRASVVIAPLLLARGVQNKVLEAMACGKAVVCSPGAAAGLTARPGQDLRVAEGAARWVHDLTSLLDDVPARQRLGAAARARVQRDYRWSACLEPLEPLLLGDKVPAPARAETPAAAAPAHAPAPLRAAA